VVVATKAPINSWAAPIFIDDFFLCDVALCVEVEAIMTVFVLFDVCCCILYMLIILFHYARSAQCLVN
jgi:hypothetical protein